MLPSRSLLPINHFGTDCSSYCRRGPYFLPTTSEPTAQHVAFAVPTSHQPLRNRLLSMLPSRSLLPTNHFGTDCPACCPRGPYFPPTTSRPTAQHVAVEVPTSHQPLRNRLLSMLPSRSLLPTNHFGTDCSACCRRGPYSTQTTSETNDQHVAVAVPTSLQPLRNRLHSMLPSRSLLPTNHFGTDCSACCRRGPYFPPTTSGPTAQHVAAAVHTSHQPLLNRLLSMLPSRSLLPTNHFGTNCCCSGPYLPPTLRNRLLSMLPSRSILPTNHFGTDCSACCRRGPYFTPTTSEPTAQHVAVAVPIFPTNHFGTDYSLSRSLLPTNHFGTACSACCRRGPYSSHQPLRNRLLSMLPSRSLLPTNHFGTDCSACCRRGHYSSNQPLRNRLLSMLPSRSLLPTNQFGTDCPACCPRGPYFPPITSEPTAQHVAFAVPTSHQPLRN